MNKEALLKFRYKNKKDFSFGNNQSFILENMVKFLTLKKK